MSKFRNALRATRHAIATALQLVLGLVLALFYAVLAMPSVIRELRDARQLSFHQNRRAVFKTNRIHHAVVGIVVFLVVATVLAVAGVEIIQNADIGTAVGAGIVSGGLIFVTICIALLFFYVGKRAAKHQL
jgi:sterol desaturase/sphingolipid hydroxylase (fatty acid hydroxylase superfamily)